jgi:hypothetical protein
VSVRLTLNTKRAEALLGAVQRRVSDFTPVLSRQMDDVVIAMEQEQFLSQGTLGRVRWAPLMATTLARKNAQGVGGLGILRFSDRLYRSVTQRTHPDREVTVSKNSATWATLVPYAVFHQLGLGRKPLRQVYPDPVPAQWIDRMKAVLKQYVVAGGR